MNLEIVTIEDCLDVYEKKGMTATINDGKLLGFEEKEN